MELRHLRHFVAVAEELNFHMAAQRLNMAQPPLSQSIRRLEDSLGVQLLDRSRRGVALTLAGIAFVSEARSAIRHADLARKLARREAEKTPEVRISFIASAMYRLLPQLLARFHENASQVAVHLSERPSPLQVAPILSGDCDVAFVSNYTKGIEECESLLVERTVLAAAIPANWPLASRKSVTLADLAEHSFILPPKYDYVLGADAMINLFKTAGVMPTLTQCEPHVSSTFALIGAGLGCTMTTATAAVTKPRNVCFVPISDSAAPVNWGITMIWKPDQLTADGKRFVDHARHYVHNTPSLMSFDSKLPDPAV
jgi:DNA-binding transcriptional LysR family regulator